METKMTIEKLVENYIKVALGIGGIRVAVVDDTVTLVKDEMWHIFLGPDSFFFVGSFSDEDFDEIDKIRHSASAIRYIFENEED